MPVTDNSFPPVLPARHRKFTIKPSTSVRVPHEAGALLVYRKYRPIGDISNVDVSWRELAGCGARRVSISVRHVVQLQDKTGQETYSCCLSLVPVARDRHHAPRPRTISLAPYIPASLLGHEPFYIFQG